MANGEGKKSESELLLLTSCQDWLHHELLKLFKYHQQQQQWWLLLFFPLLFSSSLLFFLYFFFLRWQSAWDRRWSGLNVSCLMSSYEESRVWKLLLSRQQDEPRGMRSQSVTKSRFIICSGTNYARHKQHRTRLWQKLFFQKASKFSSAGGLESSHYVTLRPGDWPLSQTITGWHLEHPQVLKVVHPDWGPYPLSLVEKKQVIHAASDFHIIHIIHILALR